MYFLKYKFVLRTNTLIVSMFILDIQLNLVVAQKCLSLYCSLPYYQLLLPPTISYCSLPYYQLLHPPLLSSTAPSPTISYCPLLYYQLLLPPLLSATAPSLTYQLLYTNCSLIYKYLILGHLDIKP